MASENRGGIGHDHAETPTRTGVITAPTLGKVTAKRASRP